MAKGSVAVTTVLLFVVLLSIIPCTLQADTSPQFEQEKLGSEPPNWYALFVKTEALMFAEKYEAFLTAARLFLSEYPDNPNAGTVRTFVTSTFERLGQVDKAAEVLRSTLPKKAALKQKAEVSQIIGGLYFRGKRYKEAAAAFREVLKTGDTLEALANARYHLALCYHELGHQKLAQNYMEGVITRYPDNDLAKKARGQLHLWGMLQRTVPVKR